MPHCGRLARIRRVTRLNVIEQYLLDDPGTRDQGTEIGAGLHQLQPRSLCTEWNWCGWVVGGAGQLATKHARPTPAWRVPTASELGTFCGEPKSGKQEACLNRLSRMPRTMARMGKFEADARETLNDGKRNSVASLFRMQSEWADQRNFRIVEQWFCNLYLLSRCRSVEFAQLQRPSLDAVLQVGRKHRTHSPPLSPKPAHVRVRVEDDLAPVRAHVSRPGTIDGAAKVARLDQRLLDPSKRRLQVSGDGVADGVGAVDETAVVVDEIVPPAAVEQLGSLDVRPVVLSVRQDLDGSGGWGDQVGRVHRLDHDGRACPWVLVVAAGAAEPDRVAVDLVDEVGDVGGGVVEAVWVDGAAGGKVAD